MNSEKKLWLISIVFGICFIVIMFLWGCTSQELTDAGAQVSHEGKETSVWAQNAQTKLQEVFLKIDKIEANIKTGINNDRVGEFKIELDSLMKEIADIDFNNPAWRGARIQKLGNLIARYGGKVPMDISDETYPIVVFKLTSAVERIEKLRQTLNTITIADGGAGSWYAILFGTGGIGVITLTLLQQWLSERGKRKAREDTIGDYGVGIENIKDKSEQKYVKEIIRKRECSRTKSNKILQKALTDARAESEVETNKTG
jgi:hypothetical protein